MRNSRHPSSNRFRQVMPWAGWICRSLSTNRITIGSDSTSNRSVTRLGVINRRRGAGFEADGVVGFEAGGADCSRGTGSFAGRGAASMAPATGRGERSRARVRPARTGVCHARRRRAPASRGRRDMQVHLVDGTYELFRYFFAVPSHLTDDGEEVGALRGVVGSVLQLIEAGATHVGVATDHVIESFRNDLWPGYKTGAGVDPTLRSQFGPLEDALALAGFCV